VTCAKGGKDDVFQVYVSMGGDEGELSIVPADCIIAVLERFTAVSSFSDWFTKGGVGLT
jgi:hypothetical protein